MNILWEKDYDDLVQRAKAFREKINPCKFKNGYCISERIKIEKGEKPSPYACCRGDINADTSVQKHCDNFIEGVGCKGDALDCLLWYCADACGNMSYEDLTYLNDLCDERESNKNLPDLCIRKIKEDFIEDEENEKRHN